MSSMKISIVSRSISGWHVQEVLRAAQDAGIEAEVVNFSAASDLKEQIDKAGDCIVWRTSSLNHQSGRASVLPFIGNKILVNETIFKYPMAAYKYFQQNMLLSKPTTRANAIPTFRASNTHALRLLAENGTLKTPFIVKPDAGSKGEGIFLLKSLDGLDTVFTDIDIKDYIFQNYIHNNGDWRVLVLGGRPLGAMRRIAKEGSFLNNVSQGATAVKEEDDKTLRVLYEIAVKAASVFDLRFCGVDIIRNEETGEYFVLEVNTAPQWNGEFGFQSIVGIDVAKELVSYCQSMYDRQHNPVPKLIGDYYRANIQYDYSATLHFASRQWLWMRDTWARQRLDELHERHVGLTPDQSERIIAESIEAYNQRDAGENHNARAKYTERYDHLYLYNAILFRVLFAETLYGQDLRPTVQKFLHDEDLLTLFNDLIQDHDAVRVLSTHAINYFYLLRNYYRNRATLSTAVQIDPYEILDMVDGYQQQIDSGEIDKPRALKLRIYLLTHAIIGASRFYERKVRLNGYKDMIRSLEATIRENYHTISLDNKLEFLVCARICNTTSSLEAIILSEAERSLSWAGNFIVDKYNDNFSRNHSLRQAEHRNVLYLMASTEFAGRQPAVAPPGKSTDKRLIGRFARVRLEELGLHRIMARVDTGASSSSLHCSHIEESDGTLTFTILDDNNPSFVGNPITVTDYKKTKVKNPTGGLQERYSIPVKVAYGTLQKTVYFTLADRGAMLYPVLLGRNFLHHDFVVDVDRQFIAEGRTQ